MRLDTEFVQLPLRFDAARLRAEVEAIPEAAWRPHPQGHPGNSALPLIARGGDPDDDGVAGPMAPTPHLERCEYAAQVLESLGTVLGRARLMRLEGRSTATRHVDANYYWAERVRVHVPVATSPAIEFLCADEARHMAAGEAWIFDTWREHDVVNPTGDRRIHLVADTVGSARFWDLVATGRAGDTPPLAVPHRPGEGATLETERDNFPVVMTPWEQAALARMLAVGLPEVGGDAAARRAFDAATTDLLRRWRIAWARFGATREGWPVYERLRTEANASLAPLEGRLTLDNGTDAVDIARQWLLHPALNPELATPTPPPPAAEAAAPRPAPPLAASPLPAPPLSAQRLAVEAAPPRSTPPDAAPSFAPAPSPSLAPRPVVIVAPPRSGSTLLFETLAQAPGLFTVGGESHHVLEAVVELHPAARGWDSNRLTHVDARPEVAAVVRERFAAQLRDRDGRPPEPGAPPARLLEKTPKNALRVGFLDAVFPDALFVFLHREPREVVASLIESWSSGRFATYPELPGWPGPAWSHLLVPEWRALADRPLAEVAVAQWRAATAHALDDLERLGPDRWIGVAYDDLVADPAATVARVAAFAGLAWDREVPAALPPSGSSLTPPAPEKWRAHEAAIAPLLPALEPLAERSRRAATHAPALAPAPARPPGSDPTPSPAPAPLRSSASSTMVELLAQTGASVLASTYQSGKLVVLRADGDRLNTHFRDLPAPMGIAVDGDRLAVGVRTAVVEYRDVPAVAQRLGPAAHDACFVPRRQHVTGDLRVHDVAYDGDGELWLVATRFSCLATLDADHSFVPRWRPPFVTALAAEDRCHLNGLAMVDGRPRYVTALGATDAAEGWRERKDRGGVLLDVDSGATVAAGLSMPHSPRWHDGRLWVLESGEGTLAVVDPATGAVETVAQLPGFTRGLAFAGPYALVGLSQVREAQLFGGLPLTGRLEARQSGVWAVDTRSGAVVAFVRFEDAVQELFDVVVLEGRRFPEIAEPDDALTRDSWVVPTAAARA